MTSQRELLALTPAQENAIKELQLALSKCNRAGVHLFGVLEDIFAVNGKHVKEVQADSGNGEELSQTTGTLRHVKATCWKGAMADDAICIIWQDHVNRDEN